MTTTLLTTKFYPPPPRDELVARPRLVERIEAGLRLGRKLVLFSAPAGFGKTTLVVEACRRQEYNLAWLSLDAAENDPNRFWRYLVSAIRRSNPTVGALAIEMLEASQPPPFETVLTGLINDLDELATPLLLVLDDYHVVENQVIHDTLNFLLDHLPPNAHLAITTRADPPLLLGRRRGRMELVEVRAADLRFLPEEALRFLNQVMRFGLISSDVEILLRRTEGWPAGLQMAALAMQGIAAGTDQSYDHDPGPGAEVALHAFVASFAGDDQYIGDYLVEEVLQRQSDQVQDFLLRTAVLDRFNSGLCAELIGSSPAAAQQLLEMLDRSNLFLVPLDSRQEWFRYHRLFADLLQRRMRQSFDSQVEPDLHARASCWFEQHRMWGEAFDHALLAGNAQRAVDLLRKSALDMFVSGQLNTLRESAQRLPQELVYADPELCLHWSWASIATGHIDECARLLAEIEKRTGVRTDVLKSPPEALLALEPGLLLFVVTLAVQRATLSLGQNDPQLAIQLSQDVLACLKVLEHRESYDAALSYSSVAYFNLGVAYKSTGALEQAGPAFVHAINNARKYSNMHILTMSVSHLAQIQTISGRLAEAVETYREALRVASEITGHPSPFISMAHAGLGLVAYECNDLPAAVEAFQRSLCIGRPWNNWESVIPASLCLARAHIARGEVAAAQSVVDTLDLDWQQMYQGGPQYWIQGWRALLMDGAGRTAAARAVLDTFAEEELQPSFYEETGQLLRARLLLASRQFAQARQLLEDLIANARPNGHTGILVPALTLMAVAWQGMNQPLQAKAVLEEALAIAEPGGYVRSFVDEGLPVASLLFHIVGEGKPGLAQYAGRLLQAFPPDWLDQLDAQPVKNHPAEVAPTISAPTMAAPTQGAGKHTLIEALSERELEVLCLLAEGLSNKAIAERLVITSGTVKVHTSNIYAKLSVNSRAAAVARARALGILA